MEFSIASYSFHRALRAGQQDMFKYITDCKNFGCAYLDPWNGHLAPLVQESDAIKASASPLQATFSNTGIDYAKLVKAAVEDGGMPVSCLAVDGAHIYEPEPEKREINKSASHRWLDIAVRLGAEYMRLDSGGDTNMTEEQFDIIVRGYNDLIKRAGDVGVKIILENHWGASRSAENVVRMLKAIDGLALLFDTNNFLPENLEQSWRMCAPYAKSVHIKTWEFDEQGNDPTVDIPKAIRILIEAGYKGCWGLESTPRNGDEFGAIPKAMALVKRSVEAV